ncbi:DeoR family transcriptional regulator [Radiobacillus kanasensis]|uniref:DeoR family transcriptional regulator n=1 Tax=Radiobacillus kanasensis TaxID=2844358 RepID=UPI001E62D35B|nr:DeoR family transcriptional regulator [Radiobacillus kanasensis]UFT99572.1 DeoR family transcriptional regulator [Radiobacillus kanasensis]
MLPIERQKQIVTWLENEGTLRVSNISKRLGVSEMTIYRDIKPLIEQKKVFKTANGVTLARENLLSPDHCTYCHKPATSRQSVKIIKLNQQVEQTCCPHCGLLRYKDIENKVSQIICQDFLKDTTISAKMATFLLNPDINLNCCQPQVIVLDSIKNAKQFQLGFGGDIYHFEGAITAIKEKMSGEPCCHSNK